MTPQVYLRKGKEESLMRRHPWIFSGAIDHIKAEDESEITEGALVEIYTRTGDFIALGHYQIGSIAVRVLTFDKEPIDQAWWNRRIAVAYDVRRTLGLTDNPDTDCYRLVHGEGDGLPGLVVDIYARWPSSSATPSACTLPARILRGRSWLPTATASRPSTTKVRKPYPSTPGWVLWTDTCGEAPTIRRTW